MPCKVLILTQYFPPETGAPQARLSEMALLLKEKGYDIEILTAMPNYPAGKIQESYRGKISLRETWQGIPVVRTFIYPTKKPNLIPRLLNYFSFVFSSFVIGLFRTRRPDIILVESPPLFLGFSAVMLKWLKRSKLVFNVSDLWPETAVALGLYDRTSTFVRLAEKLERFFYRTANACTGQSYGIVRGVREKSGKTPVAFIPNGADCEKFSPEHRNRSGLGHGFEQDKIVVGYAGLIGIAQGIGLILETAKRCQHRKGIVFTIVGDGPERDALEQQAKQDGLDNVVFTGLVAKENIPVMVASFDITIIPLKSYIPGALPSKMYEAMASGVPILLAAEGDPKELLQRADAGIYVPYDAVSSLAAAVEQLADDSDLRTQYGMQGRSYVLQHHQRHIIADRLASVFDATLSGDKTMFEEAYHSGFHPPAA